MSQNIFISYSRKDKYFVEKLANDLKARNYPVWFDASLRGGERFQEKIEAAIRSSYEIIVILSPNSVNSQWVQYEGSLAYSLRKRIIPVMYHYLNHDQQLPLWASNLQFVTFINVPYEEALNLLLQSLSPAPMNIDKQLSQIRLQMIQADSSRELSKLHYQVNSILSDYPTHIEALQLKDQISSMLDYARVTEIRPMARMAPPAKVGSPKKKKKKKRKFRLQAVLAFVSALILIIFGTYVLVKPDSGPPANISPISNGSGFGLFILIGMLIIVLIVTISIRVKKR